MSNKLSPASQDFRPDIGISQSGQLVELNTDATEVYLNQNLARTELGFEDFDPYHDKDSARMTAAAMLEGALLDLDERGVENNDRYEVENALKTVTTLEPDEERGLSRIGVATKEAERLERYVKTFYETGDKRIDEATSKLNSARLVVDVLTVAEDDQSAIYNEVTSGKEGEDFDVAEVNARIAMADAHNGLVRNNRHRRNSVKKRIT
jgi:hypothetical protein